MLPALFASPATEKETPRSRIVRRMRSIVRNAE
jgi:hypothetical protein